MFLQEPPPIDKSEKLNIMDASPPPGVVELPATPEILEEPNGDILKGKICLSHTRIKNLPKSRGFFSFILS